MKKFVAMILALTAVLVCFTGCDSVGKEEREYTNMIKEQGFDMIGMPDISNFFEMGQLKDLYELRDDPNLVCYWYTKNTMTGKWVYEGTCIGFGIPYGSSITRPESTTNRDSSIVVPQAEPNGLYNNGLTTSATWILSIDENGEIKPRYVEHEICVAMDKIEAFKCEDWSIPSDY